MKAIVFVLVGALGCGGDKDPVEKAKSFRTEVCACEQKDCKAVRDYAAWVLTLDDQAIATEKKVEIGKIQHEITDCMRKKPYPERR